MKHFFELLKKLNIKFLSILMIFTIAFFYILDVQSASEMQSLLIQSIRDFLSWEKLILIVNLAIFTVICGHAITVQETNNKETIIFRTPIKILNTALEVATHVSISSSAITLLKGAFIQHFFDDKSYFLEFDKIDVVLLIVVSLILLWYVGSTVFIMLKEALFISNTTTPIPVEEIPSK